MHVPSALEAAREVIRSFSAVELVEGTCQVARWGLAAEMGDKKVLDLAREVLGIAGEGLRQLEQESGQDHKKYLEPLLKVAEAGESPGEAVRRAWQGDLLSYLRQFEL